MASAKCLYYFDSDERDTSVKLTFDNDVIKPPTIIEDYFKEINDNLKTDYNDYFTKPSFDKPNDDQNEDDEHDPRENDVDHFLNDEYDDHFLNDDEDDDDNDNGYLEDPSYHVVFKK
jgi:hypothetical protein